MQRFITLKKSLKGAKDLGAVHKYVVFLCKRLITTIKTSFDYIIHSFHSLIENKGSINYLYGSMEIIPDRIRLEKRPLKDWSVTSTVVMTMRWIVGSIVKNQASCDKWLIPEAVINTFRA